MSKHDVGSNNNSGIDELHVNKSDQFKDFAYIISHDLKKPLRAISNYSQFLLEDYAGKISDDADRTLHKLIDLSRKSQQIVDQVYNYACIDQVNTTNELIDLNMLLPEIINSIYDVYNDSKLSINLIGNFPVVICNKTKITELFYNIILNAVIYNDKPYKKIDINHNVTRNEFLIQDNGIGIDTKYFGKIFMLFKRLYSKNIAYEGNGVGLTMAQKIVEYYGGKIWIQSQSGEGTKVYFTLNNKNNNNV